MTTVFACFRRSLLKQRYNAGSVIIYSGYIIGPHGIKLPAKVSIQVAWNVYGVDLKQYTYLYISIYIYSYKDIYIYIYTHIRLQTYTCTYTYIYTYMYIYTYTHIHIHTHMWVDIKFLLASLYSLLPGDAIYWYRSVVNTGPGVPCCLMVPSHGLNQCCHIINNDVYFTKWQQHCKCSRMWSLRNIQITFEIPRRQWVKSLDCVLWSSKYKQNSMTIGWTVSFDQASINKIAWQKSNRTWSNDTCTTHVYRFKLNCIGP